MDGTPPRVELAENWLVQQNSRQLSCAWLFHRTLLGFLVRPKQLPRRLHLLAPPALGRWSLTEAHGTRARTCGSRPIRFALDQSSSGPALGPLLAKGMAGNYCGMNFRLLARWPSKDILPTSVACDTACEALRHYRRMRKNRMEVLIIVTWEGAGSREITTHRLRTLAESERAKIRRPKRRNWKTVTGALVGMVASTLPRAFSDIEIELAATTLATSLCF